MNEFDFSWTENLWEVGAPIRDQSREIAWRKEQADKKLAAAQAAHEESMRDIRMAANRLTTTITGLWTEEEIEGAKKGIMI